MGVLGAQKLPGMLCVPRSHKEADLLPRGRIIRMEALSLKSPATIQAQLEELRKALEGRSQARCDYTTQEMHILATGTSSGGTCVKQKIGAGSRSSSSAFPWSAIERTCYGGCQG